MVMWQPAGERFLPNQVELSNTIRSYWVEVAQWLRALIYSDLLNLGNREAIEERLNRTGDISHALFSRYYGPEIAEQVRASNLKYFNNVQAMIEAYKSNDAQAIQLYRALMYDDADILADILSRVNRYWDKATLQTMFYVLVSNTESQIENIVSGDYTKEIESFDDYVKQTYRISDELTYGILRQFQI